MTFANKYLQKHNIERDLCEAPIPEDLNLIMIIPAYDEPNIIESLECILECENTINSCEIHILFNSSEKDSHELRSINRNQYENLKSWVQNKKRAKIDIYPSIIENLPKKHAGVGLARKILMDNAIYRFNKINNKNGIIVSFDADSLCSKNLFSNLEKTYMLNPKLNGMSHCFEHPLEGTEHNIETYDSITAYELYMRYYKLGNELAGHKHSVYTVGSSFSCTADAYVKQGGMNKRQAGEDFYFIQKIVSMGNFIENNNICIYPSSRISDRTPYGTGRTITEINESGYENYLVFNYKAFDDVKIFIELIPKLYKKSIEENTETIKSNINNHFFNFICSENLISKIDILNKNTGSLKKFEHNFFNIFNLVIVLKYMNYSHQHIYKHISIEQASKYLLSKLGIKTETDSLRKALIEIRKYENKTT
ncbi:MAG: hypothetical protein N4A49_14475 [Marinifilaceae bacterium]|jgi:hypothetical protein|nr:hypothetical protein [Marinifilaceae bacterium]